MNTTTDAKLSAMNAGVVKIGHFRINRLGFGAMRITGQGIWGPPADEANALAVLRRAVELDVNFIDTADAYGPEVSERLIRQALHPYDGVFVATKGGLLRGGPGIWNPDGNPEYLREACAASLERLGLEQLMLYQFHRPDPAVPFLDSVRTLAQLQQAGKIRHIGLSNVTLEQLKRAREAATIVTVQNQYNLAHRRDSDPIIDYCEQEGIVFIPWYPIGGDSPLAQQALQAVADKHGASKQQIALAWLLNRSPIMLPIPGTSSLEHLEENVAAANISLDDDDFSRLDRVAD